MRVNRDYKSVVRFERRWGALPRHRRTRRHLHTTPRYTKDIYLWVEARPDNLEV
jgi:hypothetical protein